MARLVKRDANGPMRIDTAEGPKFICMCGLSAGQPFCDGSHKSTRAEDPAKCYIYRDGEAREIDNPGL